MIYNRYTFNNVFASNYINVVCNQLMQGLTDEKFVDLNEHFALAGDAADCYINSDPGPIVNVQFKTDEREIYIFIAKNLKKMCPTIKSMETFEERIIALFDDVYFEFYLESSISTTNHLGIYTTR